METTADKSLSIPDNHCYKAADWMPHTLPATATLSSPTPFQKDNQYPLSNV